MDYTGLYFPKLSRADALLERRAHKASVKAYEQAEKAKVVARDGAHTCRLVPQCAERERHETAHLDDKGMGGDHGLRSTSDLMIRGCVFHHRGNWSLHSKDLRVEFLTELKADGPIAVYGRDESGRWYCIGQEASVGVWEHD